MTTTSVPSTGKKGGVKPSLPSMRFGAFLTIIGAAILALGAWGAAQGARTWQWPRAEATIIDSDLKRFESEARRGSATAQYDRDYWYSFAVHYRYEVRGMEYVTGGVEPYDFGMQNSAGAQKMNERHPVGSTARVAYDPANPRVAYLEPGPSSFSLILIAIGLIMGSSGLWVRSLARRGIGHMEGERVAS
jgi:hypothetical protein